MKKILFTVVLIVFSANSFAQKKEIPEAVKTKFAQLYPNAQKADWEKEGDNYEVEFKQGKEEIVVLLNPGVNVLETETQINLSALPKAISEYTIKNYPGRKIKEAAKIVDDKGTVTYEAEIKEGDLIFDATGTFLKLDKEVGDDKD